MPRFAIHAIETETYDMGDDRTRRAASFDRQHGTANHVNSIGLVDQSRMDGGLIATVEAPEGSALGETADGDTTLMPAGDPNGLSADEVLALARAGRDGFRIA